MRQRYDIFNPVAVMELKLHRDKLYSKLEPLYLSLYYEKDAVKFKFQDQYISALVNQIKRLDKQLESVNV
jgi:hypothetical protein